MEPSKHQSRMSSLPTTPLPKGYAKKNFRLLSNGSKRIVILYGWLASQDRHLDKYCSFILHRGFDVLCVKICYPQVFYPARGSLILGEKIVKFLADSDYDSIVHYTFSVGAYMMGVVDQHMAEFSPELLPKVRGLIIDSAVDYADRRDGIIRSMTDNTILTWLLRCKFVIFDFAIRPFGSQAHQHSIGVHVKANSRRCPTLTYYSYSDKLGSFVAMDDLVKDYRKRKIPVMARTFRDTPHVQHYQFYPEEYLSSFDKFLQFIYKDFA